MHTPLTWVASRLQSLSMTNQVFQTDTFKKWLLTLKDKQTARAITIRLARVEAGNLGDIKPVGQGISEFRIFTGKGYRIYFTQSGQHVVILLCGGDKSSQHKDIIAARKIAATIEGKL